MFSADVFFPLGYLHDGAGEKRGGLKNKTGLDEPQSVERSGMNDITNARDTDTVGFNVLVFFFG